MGSGYSKYKQNGGALKYTADFLGLGAIWDSLNQSAISVAGMPSFLVQVAKVAGVALVGVILFFLITFLLKYKHNETIIPNVEGAENIMSLAERGVKLAKPI